MFRLARIDRHFRRYLRSGDPRALGAVFDAAAPELLKIAAWLVGSRQQAEDIVQNAFLVAIERRAGFDVDRSVMPWLCGIVANLARSERRRRQRGRPPTEVDAEVEPAVDADPALAADAREFRAQFARAVTGLAQPYASVLELHLEHGLHANEIARVLDRPAGTVRAQITRGLELLRKRLPRGFVAGCAFVATPPARLAAMRAAVLAHARVALPPAAAPAAVAVGVGLLLMNKKLVVVGAVCASLLAFVVWHANGSPSQLGAGGGDGIGAGPAAATGGEFRVVSAPEEPARTEAAVAAATAPGPTAATGRIEVVARWLADGAPAARQAIEVVCAADPLAEVRPRRALTDDAGRCVLDAVPVGSAVVYASTGKSGRVAVPAGGSVCVEFDLEAWGRVRGTVLDAAGQPVPDADVWVSSEVRYRADPRGTRPGFGQYGDFTLRSDPAGRFVTRVGPRQRLSASKRGHGPSPMVAPCYGSAPADGAEIVLRLTAEGSALVVDVRDASGTAVPGALVLVGPEVPLLLDQVTMDSTPPALRAVTADDGVAAFEAVPTGRLPVQVRAAGFAPWQGEQELLPSATSRLAVRLEAEATVAGVATDDDGVAVGDALVCWGSQSELRSSSCATDASGRFELGGLPAGEVQLLALREGVGRCSVATVVAPGERHTWNPVLSVRPAIRGRVVDADGRPLAGAYVACAGDGGARDSATVTVGDDGRFALGPLRADGVYTVTAEAVDERHGAARAQQRGVVPGADLLLRIVPGAVRSARLRGRLLAADGGPAFRVRLVVGPPRGEATDDVIGHDLGVAADGTFDSGPALPGRIRLTVVRQGMQLADLGEHELLPEGVLDLGDLRLPQPGGLRLRIAGDGAGTGGVVSLQRDGDFVDDRSLEAEIVRWDELAPGRYRVQVRRGGAAPAVGAVTVEVEAGKVAEAELRLEPAHRCELYLHAPESCPRRVDLVVSAADGRELLRERRHRPDAGEPLTILVPAGALRLEVRTGDGHHAEARLTVPTPQPLTLNLTK